MTPGLIEKLRAARAALDDAIRAAEAERAEVRVPLPPPPPRNIQLTDGRSLPPPGEANP